MISGANRGIGAAIAHALAESGWRLSLGMRCPQASDRRRLVERYDAREPATAERWLAATVRAFGRLDALVNNAGVLIPHPLTAPDTEPVLDMLRVNALGPWRLTSLALPHLARTGGRIVDIASISGLRATVPAEAGYCVSKFAMMGLSAVAAQAARPLGVGVTAVCPGWVDTDMARSLPGVTPEGALDPAVVARAVRDVLQQPSGVDIPRIILDVP